MAFLNDPPPPTVQDSAQKLMFVIWSTRLYSQKCDPVTVTAKHYRNEFPKQFMLDNNMFLLVMHSISKQAVCHQDVLKYTP